MKRVAIVQSSYLPWRGYFDIIHDVDVFVFYDDVQMTRADWRNRNILKTRDTYFWLTVPVAKHGKRAIDEVEIAGHSWQKKHYTSLVQHYARTRYLDLFTGWLEEIYLEQHWKTLSGLNQRLIVDISRKYLSLSTEFVNSRTIGAEGRKTERLISLLTKIGASHYISGPSARAYIDEKQFMEAGITLEYKNYPRYPEYGHVHGPLDRELSIVDVLFHTGPEAATYIWDRKMTAA